MQVTDTACESNESAPPMFKGCPRIEKCEQPMSVPEKGKGKKVEVEIEGLEVTLVADEE